PVEAGQDAGDGVAADAGVAEVEGQPRVAGVAERLEVIRVQVLGGDAVAGHDPGVAVTQREPGRFGRPGRGGERERNADEEGRAAALLKLPDGFRATLFAGEPDVVKPIAMTTDDRGRLWVVESHSYPHWITDGRPGRDRVLIFEDTKGTGRFDKRTVFLDNGTNLSGIALGFGGVWLCATPNLLFIPVRPGEDKPAGPPEVVLDGWDLKAKHNVFNGLTWGPDGYLYGLNGISSNSRVGKPGTPDDRRTPLNCSVWRLHPTRRTFEVVCWGTTNP